jgi:hypothetical protein
MTQEIDQLAEQMATQAQQSAPATVDVPIEQPTPRPQQQPQDDAPRRQRKTPKIPEITSEMKWLSSLSALMGCLWLATAPLLVVSHWFPLTHVITFVVVGSLGLMGYLVIRDDKSTAYVWAWLMAMSGYAAILLTGVSK